MERGLSLPRNRTSLLLVGLLCLLVIGIADRLVDDSIPLALLYLGPVVLMSTVLARWEIPLLGLVCTAAAEFSDAYPWTPRNGVARDALYFLAYTAAGLYVSEILTRRRAEQTHVVALEAEMEARRGVEEQLRLVVANSSIAIITSNEAGEILHANDTAEQLFAGEAGVFREREARLQRSSLNVFMPSLGRVQIRKQGWEQLRTMMQCQGFRQGGEPFMADVWFSTYMTSGGGRMTAMIVDSSLELRDREEANLEQVLVGSRLAIGALSHEIRNICAAISIVHQNLHVSLASTGQAKDFDALSQLVSALERLASQELSLTRRQSTRLHLGTFLFDLYIIVAPSLREAGIALEWLIDTNLPEVWADQHSLLQVFLNLFRNAEKALVAVDSGRLRLHASRDAVELGNVHIMVSDNGPGVAFPEQLFRPFGASGGTSGLGLYLSRAMMLSFHGDLRYEASDVGATFVLEMTAAEVEP